MTTLSTIKNTIVRPALTRLGLGQTVAVNLVTGVGSVESGYRTRRQAGGGPALGYWQIERPTYDDITMRWLSSHMMLSYRLASLAQRGAGSFEQIETNDAYAAAVCRLKFFMSPEPLPENDAEALCWYWKRIYNTALGAGRVDAGTIALFQQAIDA